MKKLLSLLIALAMLLSCTAALAEDTEAAIPAMDPITVNAKMNLNSDIIASLLAVQADEATMQLMNNVLAIINEASVQAVITSGGVQFDLKLRDALMLSTSAVQNEQGLVVASDLFPSYVLTLSNETIGQVMQQFSESAAQSGVGMDEALEAIVVAAQTHFMPLLQTAFGEAEQGDFVVSGETNTHYNTKLPVTLTQGQLAEALVLFVQDAAKNETIQAVMAASMSDEIDMTELEAAIAELRENEEEYNKVLPITVYANMSAEGGMQDAYAEVQIPDGEETVKVAVTIQESGAVVVRVVSGDDEVNVTVTMLENGVNVQVVMTQEGMQLGYDVTIAEQNDVLTANVQISLFGTAVLTAEITAVPGGEITYPASLEGKQELAVEALLADEDGTVAGALLADVQGNGLNTLLTNASSVMPAEVTALLNAVTAAMTDGMDAQAE